MPTKKICAAGIDLGTTYSSLAILNEYGEPEIIANAEGDRLTPSAIFFDENVVVVGTIAKESAIAHPDNVILFSKREMGNPNWYFKYKDKRLTPPDVSSFVLKKLKKDAEDLLAYSVPYAVITVPAYFDDVRRRATMHAGEIAGFKILKLINEPTAAAIAFGAQKQLNNETVLVYDLGGGTFDVTLMRVENRGQDIRIIASEGDHQLGGKDFDDAIIRLCVNTFIQEHGFDPSEDASENQQLRMDAEKAKKELSVRNKCIVLVRAKGHRSQVTITREQFDEAIRPKLDTTGALIRTLLKSAKVQAEEVDRVLLTGGSTRIPAVRQTVQNIFMKEPDISINPDEAVSLGAAIVAALELSKLKDEDLEPLVVEKIGSLQITDVLSHSIGIEATVPGSDQKINSIIIKKNSPIPFDVSKEFVTQIHGQTGIKITVFQGEFQNPALCNPIGDFFLNGLPPNRPSGKKVRVTISCSNNGVVDISARDIESGIETQTKVDYAIGQSDSQVSAKKLWMQTQVIE
jgi:molecular chaperone DnaK